MAMAPKPGKPAPRKPNMTTMPVGKRQQSAKPGLPAKPAPRKRTDATIMPIKGNKPGVPSKGPAYGRPMSPGRVQIAQYKAPKGR